MKSLELSKGQGFGEGEKMLKGKESMEGEGMLVGVSGIAEPNKFIRFLSPDSEVRERKRRRRFTSGYKLRILEKTDMCSKSGEIGKILRGEGLYFSHLSIWRKQRKEGILQGISSKKRGRKEKGINPLSKELESLRKEKVRLEKELKRSFLIIEAQKKISEIMGISEERE